MAKSGKAEKIETLERSTAAAVRVELPLAPVPAGVYMQRHVEVQLSHAQARALRGLYEALHKDAARLESGRFVQSSADAVRWLLERIAASA